MTRARLYVLAPSHFCERARWALDHAGIDYVEDRWAVGPHIARARRIAPRSCLPILETGRTVLQGSDAILDWCALPGADAELERHFVDRVGPLVRSLIYSGVLNDPDGNILDVLLDGVPTADAALARLAWPATRRAMIVGMDARADRLPALAAEVAEELDRFGRRLAGRPYLAGDAFGRADLTAASLLAPLARPEAMAIYKKTTMPGDLKAALTGWAETPALTWVNAVYRRHRSRSVP